MKNRVPQALESFESQNRQSVLFYQWLQYQLFCQFARVRQYAKKQGVF